jgi:Uma2 family endonuclease
MKAAELMTFEQFEQLPETPGKHELLDGELIELPPAKTSHMKISRRVLRLLEASAADRDRIWFETGYRFADGSWLQPDVSVSWPDQAVEDDYLTGAPMLAVEVASRGYTSEQMDRKIARYFAEGAEEVWVIQQKTTSMTVYNLRNGEISSRRITGAYEYKSATITVSVREIIQGESAA